MVKILAAIPAYEEELAIGSVILRCHQYVDEVLVVDDGSEDRTAGVAKLAKAVVHQHARNAGKGAAIQSALQYARMKGFDAVVLLDGDGQHSPASIPDLLKPILAGQADIVLGYRDRKTSKMPLYRRIGMRILDYLTAFGSFDAVRDSQSGFRALSRAAIETINLQERDFGVESEMLIEAKEKNLRIVEVPIQVRYDVEGSTKGPLSHGFSVVDRILRITAIRHPLLFFGVPGLTMFLIGLWLGVETMDVYNTFRYFAIGKALLALIFLMLGALAVFAAIILNVMPKVIAHERRRPEVYLPKGTLYEEADAGSTRLEIERP